MKNSSLERVFLSAQWRWLVMMNWQVDPGIVQSFVPHGTELDFHDGRTYLSVVGFQFLNTKLLGVPIPFHRNFEELNLRFYVRRNVNDEVRRGVCFISELVPRLAIAQTARWGYNENYRAVPMKSEIAVADDQSSVSVKYLWKMNKCWHHVVAKSAQVPQPLTAGSIEQFIAEHYWGYSQQRNGSTFEYQVKHPSWKVWKCADFQLECDASNQYGSQFSDVLAQLPDSVFIADGSPVTVSFPDRIPVAL